MTISQIVERKFKNTKDKSLPFALDFSDYNQDHIGDLLSIYARLGTIVRLANGVYLKTPLPSSFPCTLEFKRGVSKDFTLKDKTTATLCMALKSIGNGHVTDEQKTVLRSFLNGYIQDHDIKGDLKRMPSESGNS